MEKEYITFGKLKKYLTCQDYFVWHNFSDLNFSNDDFIFDDEVMFKITEAIDNIDNYLTSQVQIQTYGKINNDFRDYINKNHKLGLITSKSTAEKIIETQKLMSDSAIEVIMNGVWELEDAVASPTLYFKKEGKISNLKITNSTKLTDLIKPYFDFNVLDNAGAQVKDISYFILNTKDYKAFEIDFYETFKINTSKTPRASKSAKDDLDYQTIKAIKSGNGTNNKGFLYENHTMFEIISQRLATGNIKDPIILKEFKEYIDAIVSAREKEFDEEELKFDFTKWGSNPDLVNIIENCFPVYKGYNGNIVSKKNIFNKDSLETIAEESQVLDGILKGEIQINNEKWLKYIIERISTSRVIWYDFESFSIPFPTIDHFLPYQHASFQTSIIETKNEKEISKENLVFDPITFNGQNFIETINKIYANKADAYVVYNESYENTRLKEMVKHLEIIEHKEAQSCHEKVEWIIQNTLDLNKAFKCSKNNLPPILVPELKGKSSIKLVEKFITNNNYPFAKLIKPYKELEVQNGSMAMDIAIKRVLKIIGENEWKQKKAFLKEYCENDVRAMIMVYEFIKSQI